MEELVLADIDADGLAAIGAQLRASGAEAIEVLTDVREGSAVERQPVGRAPHSVRTFVPLLLRIPTAGTWSMSPPSAACSADR
jgi:hypothetical protein